MSATQSAIEMTMRPAERSATGLRVSDDFKFAVVFAVIHLPLGIIFYRIGGIAVIHPLAVFSLGLYWAFKPTIGLERVSALCIYMIASEVLWRMVDLEQIPWEFGKYGISVIMIIALFRRRTYRVPPLPTAFILLLIPGCLITFASFDADFARRLVSFNMSGPLALSVCCWFFLNARLQHHDIRKMFVVAIAPLLSVAVVTLFLTVSNPNIEFSMESNTDTSGGFGPNQVSSMLGMGAFLAVATLLLFNRTNKEKVFFGIAALFLSAQSVMTFSRGGMYNAVGALLFIIFFLVNDAKTFFRRVIPPLAIAVVFLLIVFPILDDYTGGMLEKRFQSTEDTNRIEIVESDFQILAENPLLGVGVGVAGSYRAKFLEFSSASHTEFSRIISEHGILGLLAIACLFVAAISVIKKQSPGFGRAFKAGMIAWCFLFMMNAGMRLAAPSFLFGLGFATIATVSRPNRKRFRKPGNSPARSSLQAVEVDHP